LQIILLQLDIPYTVVKVLPVKVWKILSLKDLVEKTLASKIIIAKLFTTQHFTIGEAVDSSVYMLAKSLFAVSCDAEIHFQFSVFSIMGSMKLQCCLTWPNSS